MLKNSVDRTFGKVPEFIPTEFSGNTVALPGIMCAGDHLGPGTVYLEHLGNSTNINDALIVDAASWKADWLVTEDARLRDRVAKTSSQFVLMPYDDFKAALTGLSEFAG